MNQTIMCSEFVKRQTKNSGFSHFETEAKDEWDMLARIVAACINMPQNIKAGYRDGVILVSVPASGFMYEIPFQFYSGTLKLNENNKLCAAYAARRIGEDPYIKVGVRAKKQPAKFVEIVCYRADVLAENNERSVDADWEIICIKARVSDEDEPMDPVTMARNFLHMKGGTKGSFSAEEFAKSIIYWNNHCMTISQISWYKSFFHFLYKLFRIS
jgi:hypothetical protein